MLLGVLHRPALEVLAFVSRRDTVSPQNTDSFLALTLSCTYHKHMRMILILSSALLASCFASTGREAPVEARADLCCAADCGGGNYCGVSACAAFPMLICQSQDLAPGGCGPFFADCDEPSDCDAGEVCRPSETERIYYCQAPPSGCDGGDSGACEFACRSDADCPASAPRCGLFGYGDVGECATFGICTT